ncbi:ribonuclease R [Fluviicola sp.]|jgi:ribonuclease R|uniref:ribonuclease R n=1 Tax=Fluviicola sp. TaxID=1917219 RepID=UPI002829C650|nr:ribonuclease R [Fluviicola sp.]MDR0802244.1 ribonuclease R [Fluviicola sp.]
MGKKRPAKKIKDKSTKKLKTGLYHNIRRLFEKHSESLLNYKQVCSLLHVHESESRKLVVTLLRELETEGFIRQNGYATYMYSNQLETIEGELELTMRGSGFVNLGKNQKDIFIAPHNLGQAIHGDIVRVVLTKKSRNRPEGRIVEVISRERTQFVGTISLYDKHAFLIPDNTKTGVKIYIPLEKLNKAQNNDKALVKITVWPKSAEFPFGEVIQTLGGNSVHDNEMISILVGQGIPIEFDSDVMSEAEQVTLELDPEEVAKRRDFRNILTFTIDPVDAKDFDDALSIQKLENGRFEISVHIADVSQYVKPDSAMDKEALKRGNSVYLVDRVIPMLPEQLSNMVCSLRPKEDKFTFSAVFEIDERGKIHKEWFGKSIIHSDHRFTYEDAQEILEGANGPYKEELHILDKIAKIYRKERFKKGALMINSEEIRFKLDENKEPVDVVVKVSKDAHQLIEEFMLLANKHVAMFVGKPQKGKDPVPFVYRVHDKPDPEKIALFSLFLDKFGYSLESSSPEKAAQSINKLLSDIQLKNEYNIIQQMAIRSMAKATYDTENIGHYGLAFEYYTHFTSPIRRYADLMVHRILLECLEHKTHKYNQVLDDICKRISRTERKAAEAERESNKYFQVVFVHDKIGEEFDGIVSGLAEHGLYVRMNENACEGMVPIQELPGDRYSFDEKTMTIVGQKTGRLFHFGDSVRVKISEVSPKKRTIDLELVSAG